MNKRNFAKLSILLICFLIIVLKPIVASAASGELSGSMTKSSYTNVNLTSLGDVDWAIWGYSNSGTSTSLSPNESMSGGSGISNLTDINPGTYDVLRGLGQFHINHTFNWSNGTSVTGATGAYVGLQHNVKATYEIGDGFSFTVPADTTKRRLIVYTAFHYGVGELTATLSDGSATQLKLQQDSKTNGNDPSRFIIDYSAGSDGQILTVKFITTWNGTDGNGNAQIYAAALSDYHTATINIKKGGIPTNASGAVELRQGGSTVATATVNATGIYSALVLNGDYDIYIDGVDTGDNISISASDSSITMNYYTVNFSVMDYGTASGSSITATYNGSTISIGDVVLGGKALEIKATGAGASVYEYAWAGAGTNGETINELSISSLSSNVNATCTVTGMTHVSVAFEAQGGTVSPISQSKLYSSTYGKASDGTTNDVLPTPTNFGYTFGGWWTSTGGTGNQIMDATTVTTISNHTLYAKWSVKTTTLSYNDNGGSGGQNSTKTATYGSAMPTPVTLPTRTGYYFAGYYDAISGGTQYYTSAGASTKNWDKESSTATLYAQWTINTTTLSYNDNGGSGGQNSTKTVTYGSAMPTPVTLPTRTGYYFAGYYDAISGGTQYYTSAGASTKNWDKESSTATLYAQWMSIIYNVAYDQNGGSGSIANDSGESGTTITLDNGAGYTRVNYVLDGWKINGTDYQLGGLYTMLGSDVTAEAIWVVDNDGDGVSDPDETAAGSDPNDSTDVPKKGTIKVIINDDNGLALSGMTCVINSTPTEVITNSNGVAVFNDTWLVPHRLSIRSGNSQVGTYVINFAKSESNSILITDDGSTDSEGSVNAFYAETFMYLEIVIRQNASSNWVLADSYFISSSDPAINPQTGDLSKCNVNMLWITLFIGSTFLVMHKIFWFRCKK